MPELPEVETIVRDLNRKLRNKKIIAVDTSDKKVFQLSNREIKKVIGKKIRSIERRAKMIIFDLGDCRLIIHLKMTGQLVLRTKGELIAGGHPIINQGRDLPNKFSRVTFKFNDNSSLFFNDVRRFGWVKLAVGDEFIKFNEGLGVEPLGLNFTLEYFKQVLSSKKKSTIKQALLDQKKISGIGNIYADEACFLARLLPFRKAASVKPAQIKKLHSAIIEVLKHSIRKKGTTSRDYRRTTGEEGGFVPHLNVYGREGLPCKICGQPIKKIKHVGRGTHFCANCQKY